MNEPLPVKRTMKNNKIILRLAATVASRFLRCEIALVLLHRRQDAETALHTPRVVVVYVSFDDVDLLLLTREASTVVALTLQNAPKALHWSVVDAVRYAGHTLRHAHLFEFVVKCPIRVLEPSVAVEQRVRVRIGLHRLVEGLEHQRIVVPFAYDVGNDASVVQVKDGTEIELVYLDTLIPLEFRDVGEPLFVGFVRTKLSIEQILGDVLRVLRLPGATVVAVLDGRLDTLGAADSENALVVDMDIVVVPKFVIDATVSLVRTLHVDLLHLFSKRLVLCRPGAQLAGCPLVICRA